MFQIEDGRKHLYQWDLNRRLIVENPDIIEAHYYTSSKAEMPVCEVKEEDGLRFVDIPNFLLQIAGQFRVYGYCADYTLGYEQFEIKAKAKPDDYVYTETEVKRWEDLQAELDRLVMECENALRAAQSFEERMISNEQSMKDLSEKADTTQNQILDLGNQFGAYDRIIDRLDQEIDASNLSISQLQKNLTETKTEIMLEVSNCSENIKQNDNKILALQSEFVGVTEQSMDNKKQLLNQEKRLYNIEQHINNNYFITDDEVVYNKFIPTNACPFAQVDRIGGMTYKSNNLLQGNYYNKNRTSAGITGSDNGDGSITLNGVNDGSAQTTYYLFHAEKQPLYLPAGTYSRNIPNSGATISMSVTDGKTYFGNTFTLEQGKNVSVFLKIAKNDPTVFDNFVVYPMLNRGDTALPYEIPFEGLRDTAVSELMSEGANLIPFPYLDTDKTVEGVAYTINSDGGISVGGTAIGYSEFFLLNKYSISQLPKVFTMSLSGNYTNIAYDASIYDEKENLIAIIANSAITSTTVDLSAYPNARMIRFAIKRRYNNQECSGVVYPMLNYGTITTPYKQYRGTINTFEIADEIKTLDGYGEGLTTGENYIDFGSKKYIQNFKKTVLTGNENWYQSTTASGITVYFCVIAGLEPKASRIECQINSHFGYGDYQNGLSVHAGGICRAYVTNRFTTLEEWVTYLKEQYANNTPVEIGIIVAEPIEIDISDHLTDDSFIEVEGGGAIKAINEYNNAAPSTITYLLKEGSI